MTLTGISEVAFLPLLPDSCSFVLSCFLSFFLFFETGCHYLAVADLQLTVHTRLG